MTKAEIKEEILENEGWIYDRSALVRGYSPAGCVDTMQTRKGFYYKRVYTSTCKGKKKEYQLTHVYRKAVEE